MSQENVEIVRRTFEAARRRDVAGQQAPYASDVEMDFSDSPFADFVGPEPRRGMDEIEAAFRDFFSAFDAVEADVHEVIAAGEHVISVFTHRGRGRHSGVEVEWKDMAGLWTFKERRIARVTWLRTREQAFRAAGLPG